MTVNSRFRCTLGKKACSVRVETSPETKAPLFVNEGNTIVYKLPASYSIGTVPVKNGH